MMKTEKPTKTRKVQLIPIMANVQKLISPSPETELDIWLKNLVYLRSPGK